MLQKLISIFIKIPCFCLTFSLFITKASGQDAKNQKTSTFLKEHKIPDDLATFRIKQFQTKKDKIHDDLGCSVRSEIVALPESFEKLLSFIKMYGAGFRCYYAKNNDFPFNDISIIFSITDSRQNNVNHFYKISTKDAFLYPMKRTTVQSKWVGTEVRPILSSSASTHPGTPETESIYYDVGHVDELIEFFKGEVESVIIHFSAYKKDLNPNPTQDDTAYDGQLGLIFEVHTKNSFQGRKSFFFGFGQKKYKATNYVDTGVPCPPPPTPDGKCPGA